MDKLINYFWNRTNKYKNKFQKYYIQNSLIEKYRVQIYFNNQMKKIKNQTNRLNEQEKNIMHFQPILQKVCSYWNSRKIIVFIIKMKNLVKMSNIL